MTKPKQPPWTHLERVAVWLRDVVMGTTYTTYNPWETAAKGDREYWLLRASDAIRFVGAGDGCTVEHSPATNPECSQRPR